MLAQTPSPALSMRIFRERGLAVISVDGEIDVSTASQLRQYMDAVVDLGQLDVLIDATELQFMDSSGLAVLIDGARRLHAKGGTLCDVMMASAKRQAPSLSALVDGTSAGAESNDCAAVGRHLQELEADTTHGPDDRPDDAFCEKCTQYYTNLCESQAWTVERRNCTLAAPDLINAHMCSGTVPTRDPNAQIPANLSCAVLGPHIATIIQAAGMHADVADMPQQVEAACEVGQWTIEIRTCLANGTTIMALQACIIPDAEAH